MTKNDRQESSQAVFAMYGGRTLRIGALIFPDMDQIDFTGPFEIFARLPDTGICIIGTQAGPFRDMNGLQLLPDATLDDVPEIDLLHVPGGPGQEALMDDEQLLGFIRRHADAGKPIFSVCTGALLCGAAGVLIGRHATTHWAALDLLPAFGAIPMSQRVVLDGALVSAAGVTAGLDGALKIAQLVRGTTAAQQIQLAIQYAPDPPLDAGSPETAPRAVLDAARKDLAALGKVRAATAKRVGRRLGITG